MYEFPALPRNTFHGLPGLLADSPPDRFGNALIDAWRDRIQKTHRLSLPPKEPIDTRV